MADTKLKPCPFCGGEAKIKHTRYWNSDTSFVECSNCFARSDEVEKSFSIASDVVAIERWNRRVNNG